MRTNKLFFRREIRAHKIEEQDRENHNTETNNETEPHFLCCCLYTRVGGEGLRHRQSNRSRFKTRPKSPFSAYKAEPKTRAVINNAYGYAVFSDLGVKILFGGTGNGRGIAVNNRTKHETFMKMIELQAGLGVGFVNSAGNSAGNQQPRPKRATRVGQWLELSRSRMGFDRHRLGPRNQRHRQKVLR